MNNRKFTFGLTIAAVACASVQAFGSGYEKSIMWGGKSSGLGGIASPYVKGSEALYFNPAGLVGEKTGQDMTLNFSAVSAQFKGPMTTSAVNGTTKIINDNAGATTLTTPFGLIYGATLNDNFGFGIGGYVSGGASAEFKDANLSPRQLKPTVETKIQIVELAAGVGYKVNEDLNLGAAWRAAFATARFGTLSYSLPVIANLTSSELTDKQFTGFKLGAQYRLNESTRLGAGFRSEINFAAKGTLTGKFDVVSSISNFATVDLEAKTTLPLAINLGVQHDLNESWRLFGEYVFTQYSRVDKIELVGNAAPFTGAAGDLADLATNWKDQHNLRLAAEYLGLATPLRFGYVYTSQVTDPAYARPTFTPPGAAHTITLGGNMLVAFGDTPINIDGGIDCTIASGDGDAASPQANESPVGTYSVSALALNLGLSYSF